MNIYHISYTHKFVGERMAMLSFKGCNFDCIGCLRKRNEYDVYAEERKYSEIKEIRKTPRKAKFIEILPLKR